MNMTDAFGDVDVVLRCIEYPCTGFIVFLAPFPSLDATSVICLGSAVSSPCHLKYQCQAVAGQAIWSLLDKRHDSKVGLVETKRKYT